MDDPKLAAEEARRAVQHEQVKSEIEGEVNAEIAAEASHRDAGDAAQVRQVADRMRHGAVEEVVESEREVERSRSAARVSQVVDYLFWILYVFLGLRFLLGMMAPPGKAPPVYALGLDNRTEADGLAVPRASEPALEVMRPLLSGVGTVRDETLFDHLRLALVTENQRIEPSAAAGFSGPALLLGSDAGRDYLERHGLWAHLPRATRRCGSSSRR